jgi:hypothetical protein
MLTQHKKIKQYNLNTKKVSSNNDCVLLEKNHTICFKSNTWSYNAISQLTEYFIQGLLYFEHNVTHQVSIDHCDHIYNVSEIFDYPLQLHPQQLDHIQHDQLVEWMSEFRSNQHLYRQTGATQSIGMVCENNYILTIECIDFETCAYKLFGALLKKHSTYVPILFVSHQIKASHIPLILKFQPKIIMCQSAISGTALDQLINEKITVFGFCRKSKYNRYSNFHI